MSIEENIEYFTHMGRYDIEGIYDGLKRYQVKEPLNKPIKLLSDGTKQKLLIILALNCKKRDSIDR